MKRGMSLLEVLISVVVSVGVILMLLQLFQVRMGYVDRLERKQAQTALQFYVKENLDCKKALYPAGGNCTNGAWLDADDLLGQPLARGNSGTVKIGNDWAVRIKCQQNPAPQLLVDYTKIKNGSPEQWNNLFGGVPLSCPPDVAPPPACTVADTTTTFNTAQIATALGLPSGWWVVQDRFHAHMICRKLSYSIATNHTFAARATSCTGNRIVAWSKTSNSFIEIDACKSAHYLSSVTCRYKETGACPCPQQKFLGPNTQSATSLVASNDANIEFPGSFSYNCLSHSGMVVVGSTSHCPRMYAGDTATPKRVCELLGYSKISSMTTTTYSSCSNNSAAKWNSSTSKFTVVAACAANKLIQTLTCSDPIAATCQSFY